MSYSYSPAGAFPSLIPSPKDLLKATEERAGLTPKQAKALKKLQHPSRSRKLKGYTEII